MFKTSSIFSEKELSLHFVAHMLVSFCLDDLTIIDVKNKTTIETIFFLEASEYV